MFKKIILVYIIILMPLIVSAFEFATPTVPMSSNGQKASFETSAQYVWTTVRTLTTADTEGTTSLSTVDFTQYKDCLIEVTATGAPTSFSAHITAQVFTTAQTGTGSYATNPQDDSRTVTRAERFLTAADGHIRFLVDTLSFVGGTSPTLVIKTKGR